MSILGDKKNLLEYYQAVGQSFREGIQKISERLFECYNQFRWPFSATKTSGRVLKMIASEIPDSQVRLICLEHLWHLAYVMDQWDVQSQVKLVFNSKTITPDIEVQLSEFIIKSEKEMEIATVNSIRDLPHLVKTAIIKADKVAKEKEAKRQAEMAQWLAEEKW